MTTIVYGHGDRMDEPWTFVPEGTTLTFYSGFDVDLSMVVGLTAMVNGATAPAKEQIKGSGKSTPVANYRLSTMEDHNVATWVALGNPTSIPGDEAGKERWVTAGQQVGIPVKVVGSDPEVPNHIPLCRTPEVCAEDADGEHICGGLLDKTKIPDSDIIIVACRGYIKAEERPVEEHYGKAGDPLHDIVDDLDDWLKEFYRTAKGDPARAEATADDLPQPNLAMLALYPRFHAWQCAREFQRLAALHDFASMVGHLTKTRDEDVVPRMLKWLEDCPAYGSAVNAALEADSSAFMTKVFDKVPDDVRRSLLDYLPVVKKAYASGASHQSAPTGAESDSESDDDFQFESWKPIDSDVKAATTRNAANIKAASSGDSLTVLACEPLVVVGNGHNQLAVDYFREQARSERGTVTIDKEEVTPGPFGPRPSPIKSLEVIGITTWEDLVETRFGQLRGDDPQKPDPEFAQTKVIFK